NATGPEKPLTMAAMLSSCSKAAARRGTLVWVPEKFLAEHKVSPWEDMPVWTGAEGGLSQIDSSKAIRCGLRFRSADETAKNTLTFCKGLPEERRHNPRAGLSPEREHEVLAAWTTSKS